MNPLIATGLIDLVKGVFNRAIPDPVERRKAEAALEEMQLRGELDHLQIRMSAINTEGASEDPWTSRARPSFLYVFYTVILMLVLVAPFVGVFFPDQMAQFFDNVAKGFDAIPEEMWWVFATGYLGYTGAREIGKKRKGGA